MGAKQPPVWPSVRGLAWGCAPTTNNHRADRRLEERRAGPRRARPRAQRTRADRAASASTSEHPWVLSSHRSGRRYAAWCGPRQRPTTGPAIAALRARKAVSTPFIPLEYLLYYHESTSVSVHPVKDYQSTPARPPAPPTPCLGTGTAHAHIVTACEEKSLRVRQTHSNTV